ncbi:MAG: hypothetical protein C5B49_00305 [Bdellovibrio sp.]|nr:MAG: hypothetical protein C5B49_00305 [Bdellovibrio sp.]
MKEIFFFSNFVFLNFGHPKRLVFQGLLVGFIWACGGFAAHAVSNSPLANGKLRLSLNWVPEPEFGGFYAAEQNGIFKQQGLDVEILPGGSTAPTIQMVATGRTEYAIVSGDEVILAHDRGATDVVALFATYQTDPLAILAHAERNYQSLADLFKDEKATLSWQSGSSYTQFLAKKYGPLKIRIAPYLGGIGPFQKDPFLAQQGFMTSEPLLAEKAHLKVKLFLVADSGWRPYNTVLITSKKRLQGSPEEVRKFVEAVRAGWLDYLAHPEAVNRAMHQLNPSMDEATFKASAELQKKYVENEWTKKQGLGKMEKSRWQELIDQLLDLKIIKSKLKAEDLFVP